MPENHFLHFSKKERAGIFVLLALVGAVTLLPRLYRKFTTPVINIEDSVLSRFTELSQAKDTLIMPDYPREKSRFGYSTNRPGNPVSPPFYFDPNTLSAEGWQSLGVKQKTIGTIQKYLSKGGKFSKAEDLEKIWGLRSEAARLIPYVRIPRPSSSENSISEKAVSIQPRKNMIIDINDADSLQWLSLPGIGPALTKRIINFRERLGGFYEVDQVSETYGLPDSVFKKIRPMLSLSGHILRKTDINTATLDELKLNPYIKYAVANAIVRYRDQHGKFRSVDDLSNVMLVTDSLLNKIHPYLEVSQ